MEESKRDIAALDASQILTAVGGDAEDVDEGQTAAEIALLRETLETISTIRNGMLLYPALRAVAETFGAPILIIFDRLKKLSGTAQAAELAFRVTIVGVPEEKRGQSIHHMDGLALIAKRKDIIVEMSLLPPILETVICMRQATRGFPGLGLLDEAFQASQSAIFARFAAIQADLKEIGDRSQDLLNATLLGMPPTGGIQ
jgi:hypothetical protein